MTNPDAATARELVEQAKVHNISDRMLAAAQVHATLAVEAAVRELIETTKSPRVFGGPPFGCLCAWVTPAGQMAYRDDHNPACPVHL
jgi:hypothetical protein